MMTYPNPEENETSLLNGLVLDKLLSGLNERDRASIGLALDGYTDDEMGTAAMYRVRIIVHGLALKAGARWTCETCSRSRWASCFGWTGKNCLDCEDKSIRWRRKRIERWLEAIDNGARWFCTVCAHDYAAEAFRPLNASVCHACAGRKAAGRAGTDA